jgi:DNA primase
MFDGDEAGQNAAEKALANYLSENIDLRVLVLPDDQDPDEFLFAHGADEFRRQIDGAVEAWDFKLQTEINRHGLQSIDARHRVLTSMLELLAKVPKLRGSAKEDVILNRLAGRTLLSEQIVRQRLAEARSAQSGTLPNGNRAGARTPQRGPDSTSRTMSAPKSAVGHKSLRVDGAPGDRSLCFFDQALTKGDRMECELLEIIFTEPSTLDVIRREIGDEDFCNEQTRAVLQVCFDLMDHDETPTFERINAVIEDVTLKRLIVWIDEQARKKEIANKLKDNLMTPSGATVPQILKLALEPIQFRRAEQQHQRNTGRIAQHPDARAGLNPTAKALLEQQQAFHQKRAAKATWQ